MCYMNCRYENSKGECRRPNLNGRTVCPHEADEDEVVFDADDYADYLRDQKEDR